MLATVSASSAQWIEIPELAMVNGGPIDAQLDGRQRMVPTSAQYRVVLSVTDGGSIPASRQRGTVYVRGRAESYFSATWRRILKVLVRESAA